MGPTTTAAIVIQTTPYRETSMLVTLLCSEHGVVRGIIKGLRSSRNRSTTPCQRGMLIDAKIYLKQSGLSLVTDIGLTDAYFAVQSDLLKSCYRDIACELLLRSPLAEQHNSQLFTVYVHFLQKLNQSQGDAATHRSFFQLLFKLFEIEGVRLSAETCSRCQKPMLQQHGGSLHIQEAVFICSSCSRATSLFMPHSFFSLLFDSKEPLSIAPREALSAIQLLIAYSQRHLHTSPQLHSVEFLKMLLSTE